MLYIYFDNLKPLFIWFIDLIANFSVGRFIFGLRFTFSSIKTLKYFLSYERYRWIGFTELSPTGYDTFS